MLDCYVDWFNTSTYEGDSKHKDTSKFVENEIKISLFWCKHFLNLHISGVLQKFMKNACYEKTAWISKLFVQK